MAAPTDGARVFAALEAINAALVGKGWPSLSPWWLRTFRQFLLGARKQLVVRGGRRGGKSSSCCAYAVATALAGEHKVPPGDTGHVLFLSTSRDEAAQRLRTIRRILDALGEKYAERGDIVELVSRPIAFRVLAASIAGVSGYTAVAIIADEVAKWRDSDTGANPATEVLASVRPALATMPNGRVLLISSPLGTEDAHATAFDDGTTDFQMVAHGATWELNPTISEADTRALERDPRIWSREYAAIPQGAISAAFDPDDISAAFRDPPAGCTFARPIISLDASSGRGDSAVFSAVQWAFPPEPAPTFCTPAGAPPPPEPPPPIMVVKPMTAFDGKFAERVPFDRLMREVARAAKREKATLVVSDQREEFAIESALREQGIRYKSLPWTNPSKSRAVERLRRLLRERLIVLPKDERLRKELLGFQEKITASGFTTWAARGREHDDRVAVLLTAMLAETEGMLSGTTLAQWEQRREEIERFAIIAAGGVPEPRFPFSRPRPVDPDNDPLLHMRAASELINMIQGK